METKEEIVIQNADKGAEEKEGESKAVDLKKAKKKKKVVKAVKAKPKKRRIEEVLKTEENGLPITFLTPQKGAENNANNSNPQEEDSENGHDEDEDSEVDIFEYEQRTQQKVEEIEFELDVRTIEEVDFKSIRGFLTNYLHKNIFNSAELVEIILSQPEVGSVIRLDNTFETYGFVSIINLYHHREKQCMEQIKKFIYAGIPPNEKKKWETFIEAPNIALLLNDRIVNVPQLIAPQLNQSLFEEVGAAVADGLPFVFEHYLYMTKFKKLSRKKDQLKKSKKERDFYKVEDEAFEEHAILSATVNTSPDEGIVILIFPSEKIPSILKHIISLVQEGYSW